MIHHREPSLRFRDDTGFFFRRPSRQILGNSNRARSPCARAVPPDGAKCYGTTPVATVLIYALFAVRRTPTHSKRPPPPPPRLTTWFVRASHRCRVDLTKSASKTRRARIVHVEAVRHRRRFFGWNRRNKAVGPDMGYTETSNETRPIPTDSFKNVEPTASGSQE